MLDVTCPFYYHLFQKWIGRGYFKDCQSGIFSSMTPTQVKLCTNPALPFSAKASIISNWREGAWLCGSNTLQQMASFSEISPFLVCNPWTAKWKRTKFRRSVAVGNGCLSAVCRPQMSVWSELTWEREIPAVAVLLTGCGCFPSICNLYSSGSACFTHPVAYFCCDSLCVCLKREQINHLLS